MPDYSKDAAGMFFAMRSKMKREPDKVKQTWFFNLIAPQIIESEQQILELLQPLLDSLTKTIQPQRELDVEVDFQEDEQGSGQIKFQFLHRGVMHEDRLATVHKTFEAYAVVRHAASAR